MKIIHCLPDASRSTLSFAFIFLLLLPALICLAGAGCKPDEDPGDDNETDPPVNSAGVSYGCSVEQGFNFQPDVRLPVGHVNTMEIGGVELSSDLGVTDPMDISGDPIEVMGVVSSIKWDGGIAEPIEITCRVSDSNKDEIVYLVQHRLEEPEVSFSFTIYNGRAPGVYFKCFHSDNEKLLGLIAKSGGDFSISIEMDPAYEVVQPLNYTFKILIYPQDVKMALHFGVGPDDAFAVPWGVEVGRWD